LDTKLSKIMAGF